MRVDRAVVDCHLLYMKILQVLHVLAISSVGFVNSSALAQYKSYERVAHLAAYPLILQNSHIMDIHKRSHFQISDAEIITLIQCRRGQYDFEQKNLQYNSGDFYGTIVQLPGSIVSAMKAANAAPNGISAPPGVSCPAFRTRMSSPISEWPYSSDTYRCGFSSKTLSMGPLLSPTEARPLKYAYIMSDEITWKQRAQDIVRAHGKFTVVDNPEEAELFIWSRRSDGATTRMGPSVNHGGYTVPETTSYRGAAIDVSWYKQDMENSDSVEQRLIFSEFHTGKNAHEKAFAKFFAALEGSTVGARKRNGC
jgi:hypothetical protein